MRFSKRVVVLLVSAVMLGNCVHNVQANIYRSLIGATVGSCGLLAGKVFSGKKKVTQADIEAVKAKLEKAEAMLEESNFAGPTQMQLRGAHKILTQELGVLQSQLKTQRLVGVFATMTTILGYSYMLFEASRSGYDVYLEKMNKSKDESGTGDDSTGGSDESEVTGGSETTGEATTGGSETGDSETTGGSETGDSETTGEVTTGGSVETDEATTGEVTDEVDPSETPEEEAPEGV